MIPGFLRTETALDEHAAQRLKLKDKFGDAINPAETRIEVAKMFPEESDKLWSEIGSSAISLETYENAWRALIRKAESLVFAARIEKTLLS